MAVAESFLTSCRTVIAALPELTAFRTAYALFDAAARANKGRYWCLAFDDAQAGMSPAYRLKKAIRDTVNGHADAPTTQSDRESAYRTLAAQYVPALERPRDNADELAELHRLIQEDAGT